MSDPLSNAPRGEGCLTVIPTYNEAENLPSLLTGIHGVAPGMHVLVVDDNSPDGTGILAESLANADGRIFVHRRPRKLGLGTAYVAGFRWALEHDYRAVIQMDADFSHDPRYLPDLIAGLEEADLVIGSRYVHGISVVNWSLWRLALSLGGNAYARWLTGIPLRDLTAGFKAFRRGLLERIPLQRIVSDGYAFQIEMNFWSHRLGARFREVPIIFADRRVGISKMNKGIVIEALATPWRLWTAWLVHGGQKSR